MLVDNLDFKLDEFHPAAASAAWHTAPPTSHRPRAFAGAASREYPRNRGVQAAAAPIGSVSRRPRPEVEMERQAVAALLLCCACAHGPPAAERPPLQSDVSRCVFQAVERGNRALSGRAEVDLLLRASGQVYAAFVRASPGVDDKPFCVCLATVATRWKLTPVATDYWRPYPVSFVAGGTSFGALTATSGPTTGQDLPDAFLPDINAPGEPLEMDEALARHTVALLPEATLAEQGTALFYARDHAGALEAFRAALAAVPDEPMALRGLAHALSEVKGGDLAEARRAAARLLEVAPQGAASHEAMLRVCIAARDDLCTFNEFMAARKAPDLAPRSRILHELQPAAEQAAARLRAKEGRGAPR